MESIEEQTKLTNVISWTFIKRGGLNLLQERVRPFVAIQHEPYFWAVAVHDDGHLELAEKKGSGVGSLHGNVGEFCYLWVTSSNGVKWSCHAREKVTEGLCQGESIGWCRHQEHHIQATTQTNCGQWCGTVTQNNAECLILKPDFVFFFFFLACCPEQ